jgi:release factor glutamine methyltransferase
VRNPKITCTAVDISKEALSMARKNAEKLKADITFVESDMFENILDKYDVIVSNPPYIPTKVIEELEEEVKLHDPFGALDGKEDGLFFYRILAEKSPLYLKNGGKIYMEIGHDQSEDVEALLRKQGFTQISTKKDLAGLDRVVFGVYNSNVE